MSPKHALREHLDILFHMHRMMRSLSRLRRSLLGHPQEAAAVSSISVTGLGGEMLIPCPFK